MSSSGSTRAFDPGRYPQRGPMEDRRGWRRVESEGIAGAERGSHPTCGTLADPHVPSFSTSRLLPSTLWQGISKKDCRRGDLALPSILPPGPSWRRSPFLGSSAPQSRNAPGRGHISALVAAPARSDSGQGIGPAGARPGWPLPGPGWLLRRGPQAKLVQELSKLPFWHPTEKYMNQKFLCFVLL